MLARTFSALTLIAACSATALPNQPAGTHSVLPKRCGGCGWYGGYGGLGFPVAASFTNDFDRNSNRANFNENTLYSNNVHANAASDNVHSLNNANILA
ncbi:hypothetical protein IWW39_004346 [Coemansia spiralis]|uniref:Uncharacterized protein n=1 Tax=Coemansia spiralis TaxID=417178 RepID=A0A9W8GJQ2_9FUNG|nr:hypothetical protein IWW39_004346 [Coemansia spiralis]